MKYAYIVLVVLAIVGGAYYLSTKPSTETVKVGALLCLSGTCAEWGENSLKGLELAVEEINGHGGILGKQVEIVVQDSAEDEVRNSVSGYQTLRQQGVSFIVGPSWTPAGLALAPIAKTDDVIVISPSLGVADFNEAGENLFNTWPHDELATRYLARAAYEQGARTAAIFSSTQAWEQAQGNAFEDEFEKIGGKVLLKTEVHEDVRDFRTEAIKVKNLSPDVVMFANLTHMDLAAKDLKHVGYAGEKVSILMDETRIANAQGGLEDTVYVQAPAAQAWFADAFRKKFGGEPGITADTAYDALMLLARAIGDARTTDRQAVQNVMNGYSSYPGAASGDFTFDGKGGVLRDPVLWMVEDGAMVRSH